MVTSYDLPEASSIKDSRPLFPFFLPADFVYMRLAFGGSSFTFDLDGYGSVSLLDFIGFRNNFGMSI